MDTVVKTKICNTCKTEHPIECFTKDRNCKDGLKAMCRDCRVAYRQRDYVKDKAKAYMRSWHVNNRDKKKVSRIRYKQGPRGKYTKYKVNAQNRGLSFDLSFEEFLSFWKMECSYCGKSIDTIGLDRVDNTLGYLLDNVVPCCTVCNRMKRAQSKTDWIAHCRAIVERADKLYGYGSGIL